MILRSRTVRQLAAAATAGLLTVAAGAVAEPASWLEAPELHERLANLYRVPLAAFSQAGERLFWIHVLSCAALAALWLAFAKRGGPSAARRLLSRELWWHRSARLDYQLFIANALISPVFRLGLYLLQVWGVFQLSGALADEAPAAAAVPGVGPALAVTGIAVLAHDFGFFVVHWSFHRVPFLWEFHKVHHSAEVLTPFTMAREHPVFNHCRTLMSVATNVVAQTLAFHVFVGRPALVAVLGVNAVVFAHNLLGGLLRHSDVRISFGPLLSRVFISPLQHQIHHSSDPRHQNKNFGLIFAFWDGLFGSLVVPGEADGELSYGLPGHDPREHRSLLRAWFVPFRRSAEVLRRALRRGPKAAA